MQNASTNVRSNTGLWRLWDKPLPISRAEERLPKNEPKIKTEYDLDMEVEDTQFGCSKVTEEEAKQKQYQRKREEGRRIARDILRRDKVQVARVT